jgi:hypothetical protein
MLIVSGTSERKHISNMDSEHNERGQAPLGTPAGGFPFSGEPTWATGMLAAMTTPAIAAVVISWLKLHSVF